MTSDLPNDWQEIKGPGVFVEELGKELGDKHVLYGKRADAIARRKDNDDVLFEFFEDSAYAIVHLTWSGKASQIRNFPGPYFIKIRQIY